MESSQTKRDMGMPIAIIIVVLAGAVVGAWHYYFKYAPTTPVVPAGTQLPQKKMLVVRMAPLNSSGEMGTAVLRDVGGKVSVEIDMLNAPAIAQPAHIHVGSCPDPGAVKYPLTSVVKGISSTVIDTTLDQLLHGGFPFAINLHASAKNLKTYTACGDLLEAGLVVDRGSANPMPKNVGGMMVLPPRVPAK